MKVLSLKVSGKTYTTSRITAYLSRKAMEINTKSIELVKLAKQVQVDDDPDPDMDQISDLMGQMEELENLKSWFICQVYGQKFDIDQLEMSLTREEIESEVKRITDNIYGVIEKNV